MIKIILLLMLILSSEAIEADNRTLLKIPFNEREKLLRGMRDTLGVIQELIVNLANKNYAQMEKSLKSLELTPDRLERISKKGNLEFGRLSKDMHGRGIEDLVSVIKTKNDHEILLGISQFMNRCNNCHNQYKVMEWPEKDYPYPAAVNLK
jgi:hypothetical protein